MTRLFLFRKFFSNSFQLFFSEAIIAKKQQKKIFALKRNMFIQFCFPYFEGEHQNATNFLLPLILAMTSSSSQSQVLLSKIYTLQ